MPTIANPHRIADHQPRRRHRERGDSPAPSITLRLRTVTRRRALTEQLANGAEPTSTPELALRAHQLTSTRRRRHMARTLRRTVSEARNPAITRALVSIISRRAVLEANDAIQATIARLASPEPVTPKGMAMLERLITDGAASPLYNRTEPGTLRRQLLVAKSELDPTPHDLPIAA